MIMISAIELQNSVEKYKNIKPKTNKRYSNNMKYIMIMISVIILQNSRTQNLKQTNNIIIT